MHPKAAKELAKLEENVRRRIVEALKTLKPVQKWRENG